MCNQNYLVGCVHLGTDGIHSCPLFQTPGFLLLCSVGLPLDTENKDNVVEMGVDMQERKVWIEEQMKRIGKRGLKEDDTW